MKQEIGKPIKEEIINTLNLEGLMLKDQIRIVTQIIDSSNLNHEEVINFIFEPEVKLDNNIKEALIDELYNKLESELKTNEVEKIKEILLERKEAGEKITTLCKYVLENKLCLKKVIQVIETLKLSNALKDKTIAALNDVSKSSFYAPDEQKILHIQKEIKNLKLKLLQYRSIEDIKLLIIKLKEINLLDIGLDYKPIYTNNIINIVYNKLFILKNIFSNIENSSDYDETINFTKCINMMRQHIFPLLEKINNPTEENISRIIDSYGLINYICYTANKNFSTYINVLNLFIPFCQHLDKLQDSVKKVIDKDIINLILKKIYSYEKNIKLYQCSEYKSFDEYLFTDFLTNKTLTQQIKIDIIEKYITEQYKNKQEEIDIDSILDVDSILQNIIALKLEKDLVNKITTSIKDIKNIWKKKFINKLLDKTITSEEEEEEEEEEELEVSQILNAIKIKEEDKEEEEEEVELSQILDEIKIKEEELSQILDEIEIKEEELSQIFNKIRIKEETQKEAAAKKIKELEDAITKNKEFIISLEIKYNKIANDISNIEIKQKLLIEKNQDKIKYTKTEQEIELNKLNIKQSDKGTKVLLNDFLKNNQELIEPLNKIDKPEMTLGIAHIKPEMLGKANLETDNSDVI